MAEYFELGETKVRPGGYFNIQKSGGNPIPGVVNGVTAVIFKADFGPLNQVVDIAAEEGYAGIFGTGGTTDAMQQAINGGAKELVAVRLGTGGNTATVTLKDNTEEEGEDAVKITANYPGNMAFTVTIRNKLTDNATKECIIYSGIREFERVEFAAGTGEVKALVEAFASSKNFTAQEEGGKNEAIIKNVSQAPFTAGTNPTVNNEDYSNAFSKVEPYVFNTICVDTEEPQVHILLHAFVERIFNDGMLTQAVVAEKHDTALTERMAHAAAFNSEKMNYVLNPYVDAQGTTLDGYQTAARIAGMIGACPSNSSLTHTVINGFTEILERLKNSEIIAGEKSGCIVLTINQATKQVWIDSAINTLITPKDNQDDGWKKIRRVKTRYELIRRMNQLQDELAGKVDNDPNGRKTVGAQLQSVGDAMISEGKLIAFTVQLSTAYPADGDYAYYEYDTVDKDSMEHIYGIHRFRFSTNVE